MNAKTNAANEFKVGDLVKRVEYGNGIGARVGQIATVRKITRGDMLYVEYEGCLKDRDGLEGWCVAYVAKVVEDAQ